MLCGRTTESAFTHMRSLYMIILTISKGSETTERRFDAFSVSIGSASDSDENLSLPIQGLTENHILISQKQDQFQLSVKGEGLEVQLNGRRVTETVLCSGDELIIGDYTIGCVLESQPQEELADSSLDEDLIALLSQVDLGDLDNAEIEEEKDFFNENTSLSEEEEELQAFLGSIEGVDDGEDSLSEDRPPEEEVQLTEAEQDDLDIAEALSEMTESSSTPTIDDISDDYLAQLLLEFEENPPPPLAKESSEKSSEGEVSEADLEALLREGLFDELQPENTLDQRQTSTPEEAPTALEEQDVVGEAAKAGPETNQELPPQSIDESVIELDAIPVPPEPLLTEALAAGDMDAIMAIIEGESLVDDPEDEGPLDLELEAVARLISEGGSGISEEIRHLDFDELMEEALAFEPAPEEEDTGPKEIVLEFEDEDEEGEEPQLTLAEEQELKGELSRVEEGESAPVNFDELDDFEDYDDEEILGYEEDEEL